MSDIPKIRAARALANGSTQAAAARDAGVDRATVGKWVKTAEFKDMILKARDPDPEPETPSAAAEKGLTARVDDALRVIDQALAGDRSVTPQMATVALNVIKAAKTYEPQSSSTDQGPSTLTSLIAEIDAKRAAG